MYYYENKNSASEKNPAREQGRFDILVVCRYTDSNCIGTYEKMYGL
jgi:hypothetical protein